MTLMNCKDCGRAIQATTIREWNVIPREQKAASDHRSLRRRLCTACFNDLKNEAPKEEEYGKN